MVLDKISLEAVRKNPPRTLAAALKDTGFDRLRYTGHSIELEKHPDGGGEPLYRIVLGKKTIELHFQTGTEKDRRRNLRIALPALLHVLELARNHYRSVDSAPLFPLFLGVLQDVSQHLGKDALELGSEVGELQSKYDGLLQKYEELVRSSEENARILLECERRRDELYQRVQQLESMPDETLRRSVFEWIKVHGGGIDIAEFAREHRMPPSRVEEALRALSDEGYIKRRME